MRSGVNLPRQRWDEPGEMTALTGGTEAKRRLQRRQETRWKVSVEVCDSWHPSRPPGDVTMFLFISKTTEWIRWNGFWSWPGGVLWMLQRCSVWNSTRFQRWWTCYLSPWDGVFIQLQLWRRNNGRNNAITSLTEETVWATAQCESTEETFLWIVL